MYHHILQHSSTCILIQIEPPFRPEVTDDTDVSNFDTDFTSEDPTLTPPDDSEFTVIASLLSTLASSQACICCHILRPASVVTFPGLHLLSHFQACICCYIPRLASVVTFPGLHLLLHSQACICCHIPRPASVVTFPDLHLLSHSQACICCHIPRLASVVTLCLYLVCVFYALGQIQLHQRF